MKLKYKLWRVTAQETRPTDAYSHFPIDMLRYDPAFMQKEELRQLVADNGAIKRFTNVHTLIQVQLAGYRAAVMTPTFERYRSFGGAWGSAKWEELKIEQWEFSSKLVPSDWLTIVGFGKDLIPYCVSLQSYMDAKNMDTWIQHFYAIKAGKIPNPIGTFEEVSK